MAAVYENIEEREKVSKELLRMMAGGKAGNLLQDNLAKQEQVIDKVLDTQKDTKQLIKELMTMEEEVAQKLFDREEGLKATLQKLQKIEEQLLRANEEDTKLKISTKELKKELEALREEIKQQDENEEDETNMSKKAMYLVHLYYQICQIDWDYSCDSSMVKGIHYGPDIAQPINLDSRLHTRCFISDYLWNLVKTSW